MTEDDREGFEPEIMTEDVGDPAAAFEALRHTIENQGGQIGAEMTIIRRGVEAAFDHFEKYRQPPDYGADLGKIIQLLAVVEERLEGVEKSPILHNGAEHYARTLKYSGEGLVRTAVLELERRTADLDRAAVNLAAYTKSAYDRKSQDLRMWFAGVVGLLAGVLLVLLLPRILPFAVDTHVAAIVLGQDRWNAGATMMRMEDPAGWRGVVDASQFVRDNAEAIRQCAEAARAAGADQRCTITVKVPAREQ